jgi:solute carrier family 26 (sodium-independent sulfate anion transporter), member 11
MAFLLTILTLASYLYCHPRKSKSGIHPIKILLTVPSGLKAVHRPVIDINLLKALKGRLLAATIVLLLEHIAIAKCRGPTTIPIPRY